MFASGSSINNRSRMMAKAAATSKGPALKSAVRQTRLPNGAGYAAAAGAAGAASAANTIAATHPNAKSKFTERRETINAVPVRQRAPRSMPPSQATTAGAFSTPSERKRYPSTLNQAAIVNRPRPWNRNKETKFVEQLGAQHADDLETRTFSEMAIQTNEMEILNGDLLIGDIKVIYPSSMLIAEIDRVRLEAKKRHLMNMERKFEEHSEGQDQHLTELKEFLEKATVTKRPRKPRQGLELDRKLINAMDDILNREITKTESITDIKGRIKKKEQELLGLFETIENIHVTNRQSPLDEKSE